MLVFVCVSQSRTWCLGFKNIMLKRGFTFLVSHYIKILSFLKWMLLWFTENVNSFNTRPLTGLFFFMSRGYFSQLALITEIISLIPRSHFSVRGRVWLFFSFFKVNWVVSVSESVPSFVLLACYTSMEICQKSSLSSLNIFLCLSWIKLLLWGF